MAKKATAGRASGARRPVTSATKVALVRQPAESELESSRAATATITPESRPSATGAPSTNAKRPAATVAVRNGATASRAAPVARATNDATGAVSPPRAKIQRTITAASQTTSRRTLIRAENYAYVKRDLVLIAVVAALMFAFMIVLHFVLRVA